MGFRRKRASSGGILSVVSLLFVISGSTAVVVGRCVELSQIISGSGSAVSIWLRFIVVSCLSSIVSVIAVSGLAGVVRS